MDKIDKFLDDLEETFAHIREREGGDSVCGLCEYDGAYIGESGDWCNECPGFNKDDCFKLSDEIRKKWKAQVVSDTNVGGTISRQQAMDALMERFKRVPTTAIIAKDTIENLPSAQPEQKKGEWILGFNNQYLEKYYYCSKCGSRKYEENKPLDYFCSNCGADMRGEQDERID